MNMSASSHKPHFFEGRWLDDNELAHALTNLSSWIERALAKNLTTPQLLAAASRYSQTLREKEGHYPRLFDCLKKTGSFSDIEIESLIMELASFLGRENLEKKLKRELGSCNPFIPERTQFEDSIFEAWAPLGFLVHIAPSNSPGVAPLSVLEGLLSGNICFLKTSSSDSLFPQLFLEGLVEADDSNVLKHFIAVARFSSNEKTYLENLFTAADGVAVWGSEEAVNSVRKTASSSTRVIDWGHKISLIYISGKRMSDLATLEKAAFECCYFEQQACSSPQCIYVETEKWSEVEKFSDEFSKILNRASQSIPKTAPSSGEQGEITLVTELQRQEAAFGQARVFEATDGSWRVLADARPGLSASPLFRTVWVKPLPRAQIMSILRPMRSYLQTAGLACELSETGALSESLTKAGVLRVRRVGEMTGSYSGEPHDGVYALQRYCKRISIQACPESKGISSFSDLQEVSPPNWRTQPPIIGKSDFQKFSPSPSHSHLYFKSGGSSGEPKLSVFSYDDYEEQMKIGAEGLYAAGFDPLSDRSMNLFFSGQLYGGFLSIFSVLEDLQAVHFPMGAQMDFPMVAESIVQNRINVLLGMPSYLIQLFEKCGDTLKKGKVEKIFFGGEHFNDAQRRYLREKFGVKLIKSVGYGSVDTGPLGYQCVDCDGSVHHLHQRLQHLEIVELEKDRPVLGSEIGRLIFSSKVRKGQSLQRYELGDVGHWIEEPCSCGRLSPRFKLLGRAGEVFRIGTIFLNYQKFVLILSERFGYAGAVQLVLTHDSKAQLQEKIIVRLSSDDHEASSFKIEDVTRTLLAEYDDLKEVVKEERLLLLEALFLPAAEMKKTSGSGKLLHIIDERTRDERTRGHRG
jgi:phenylacetate-coenzyme A ligase PaaK-like adenylate-forming protein